MTLEMQMFGNNWNDDETQKLIAEAKEYIHGIRAVGGPIDDEDKFAEDAVDFVNEKTIHNNGLTGAMLAADALWEYFWVTRNDNYRDDNPSSDWQFVVAVVDTDADELGETPLYVRGYYASQYAPWNDCVR